MTKKPLIILTGPTSVGKSKLSISLAKALDGEIISADSMQVYKNMDIGTAKIMPNEMDGVPHYLIDELEPDEEFNVLKFQQMAKKYMDDIYSRNKVPILVGGTGFYIQAVLYDIDFNSNQEDHTYRMELERIANEQGGEVLHQQLCNVDPASGEAIHPNNVKKVIRALEFYHFTGEPFSAHNQEQREKESPYEFYYFVLNKDRAKLYETINQRVDLMLEQGLVDEVRGLSQRGYTKDLVSMQGLGYKEFLDYLEGLCTLEEAVEILKRDTRHFAKRQITWFKREKEVIWVDKDQFNDDEEILDFMIDQMKFMK